MEADLPNVNYQPGFGSIEFVPSKFLEAMETAKLTTEGLDAINIEFIDNTKGYPDLHRGGVMHGRCTLFNDGLIFVSVDRSSSKKQMIENLCHELVHASDCLTVPEAYLLYNQTESDRLRKIRAGSVVTGLAISGLGLASGMMVFDTTQYNAASVCCGFMMGFAGWFESGSIEYRLHKYERRARKIAKLKPFQESIEQSFIIESY